MKAKYIQPGNTIDYKNTGSNDIAYGSIVQLGTTRAGVAAALIPAGQTGRRRAFPPRSAAPAGHRQYTAPHRRRR